MLAPLWVWTASPPPRVPAGAGSLVVADEAIPNLNPLVGQRMVDRRWQDVVFDRLLYNDEDGNGQSAIVSRIGTRDDAIVLELHPAIRFHDGSELQAADVCATLRYHGFQDRCRPLDRYLVQVRLEDPHADPFVAFDLLVLPSGLSEEDLAPNGSFARHPVGTGPMTATVGLREARFDAVPSHRRAPVDHFVVTETGDPLVGLRMLQGGGYDVMIGYPPLLQEDVTVVEWGRLPVGFRDGVTVPATVDALHPLLAGGFSGG